MTNPQGGQPPVRWQFVVAVVLIAGFVVLTALMLSWADGPAETWKNQAWVYSSVEAIVFTAVGWVFGREVHRESVQAARNDAAEAKADAKNKTEEAAEERAKGMKLAGAVTTFEPEQQVVVQGEGQDAGFEGGPNVQLSQVDRLRQLARDLYG